MSVYISSNRLLGGYLVKLWSYSLTLFDLTGDMSIIPNTSHSCLTFVNHSCLRLQYSTFIYSYSSQIFYPPTDYMSVMSWQCTGFLSPNRLHVICSMIDYSFHINNRVCSIIIQELMSYIQAMSWQSLHAYEWISECGIIAYNSKYCRTYEVNKGTMFTKH